VVKRVPKAILIESYRAGREMQEVEEEDEVMRMEGKSTTGVANFIRRNCPAILHYACHSNRKI
jgi:hypothetical protein